VKPYLTALTAVLLLTASATASAATVTVTPVKPCYRGGEPLALGGTGYTPGGKVDVTVNGTALTGSPLGADLTTGAISSKLTLAQRTGQQRKTVVATDATNPALTASTRVLLSAVSVKVKPKNGVAGHVVRIDARGFTTGKTLYAHVSKGGKLVRNFKIARLRGACRVGTTRKRLFSSTTKPGTYKVQFDTSRKRSRKTTVKSVYTVTIFPMLRPSGASAAAVADRARAAWAPTS
jgi:hypothetical protein